MVCDAAQDIGEAAIDALSFAALDQMRDGTLYVSTAGGMGPEAVAALDALLRDLVQVPDARLVIGMDRGEGGDRYAAQLATLAEAAGVWSGRILPFDDRSDWNEVLIRRAGRTSSPSTGA